MIRRPNIGSAGTDLGFALLALVSGWLGAPAVIAMLVCAGALASWAWTRRNVLAAMPLPRRLTNGAIAVAMIALVVALAYWIGLALGGHT